MTTSFPVININHLSPFIPSRGPDSINSIGAFLSTVLPSQYAQDYYANNLDLNLTYIFENLQSLSGYFIRSSITLEEFSELTTNVDPTVLENIKLLSPHLASDKDSLFHIYPGGKRIMAEKIIHYLGSTYTFRENPFYANPVDLMYDMFLTAGVLYPIGKQITAHIYSPKDICNIEDIIKYNNEYSFMSLNTFFTKFINFLIFIMSHNNELISIYLTRYSKLASNLEIKIKELETIPTHVVEFHNPFSWS